MRKEIFRLNNVIYRSGEVKLLDNFNMHIFEGEIFGLFFTDNRGKNELIRLAMDGGALDYGSLSFCGERVNSFLMPAPVKAAGISLISREELLLDEMTAAENVFFMRRNFRKYIIDSGTIRAQYERLAGEYGVDVPGDAPVRDLAPVDRYIIRLLKAVVEGSSLIIIRDLGLSSDGPEIEKFHRHLRHFAETGVSMLYISGDVTELFRVCDRVGIAESGRITRMIRRENFNESRFRDYYFDPERVKAPSAPGKKTVLRFSAALKADGQTIELDVSEGECVLVWDRSDTLIEQIVRVLSGETKPFAGHIWLDGRELASYRGRAPISFIRDASSGNSAFTDMSYLDNLCFKAAERFPAIWRKASVKQSVRNEYHALAGDDIDALAPLSLSQESMYNLVYLREHIFRPRLLVLVRPFMDTDIRLKMHILSLIGMLRETGVSLLILDSSASESSAVADRTIDIKGGRVEKETLS